MFDIHSHLLPEVDDGSRSIRESIALLRLAVQDGIEQMFLTPHVYSGRWDNDLAMLKPRFEAFARLVVSKQIPIRLYLGAEIHLTLEAIGQLERGEVPMMGAWHGASAFLLELHDARIPPFTIDAIRHLKGRSMQPILVHPERNKQVMADVDCLAPLVDAGCLLQLTAGSLTGAFGPNAARAAFTLLERDWVSFVATDAHNLRSRPPLMSQARNLIRARFGLDVAERLTLGNPSKLLAVQRGPESSVEQRLESTG